MSSVGKAVGEAMHNPSSNEQELEKSAAEKAEEQAKETLERSERVRMLVENLSYKLDIYALDEDIDGRMDRWRARCKAEADELKNERFGAEILKVHCYFAWAYYRLLATYTESKRRLILYGLGLLGAEPSMLDLLHGDQRTTPSHPCSRQSVKHIPSNRHS